MTQIKFNLYDGTSTKKCVTKLENDVIDNERLDVDCIAHGLG